MSRLATVDAGEMLSILVELDTELRRCRGFDRISAQLVASKRKLAAISKLEKQDLLDEGSVFAELWSLLKRCPDADLMIHILIDNLKRNSPLSLDTLSLGAGEKTRDDSIKGAQIPSLEAFACVPVLFATNRQYSVDAYTSKHSKVTWGIANVSIPDDHRIGVVESPRWWRFEFRRKPHRHFSVLERYCLEEKEIESIEHFRSKNASGLMFIHGYNVGFEDALLRAAQIAFDLEHNGIPILFSWPSQASTFGYLADANISEVSVFDLCKTLEFLLSGSRLSDISIIAHSMGGRLFGQTIAQIIHRGLPLSKLKEMIFAAPDIDRELFARILANVTGSGLGRSTLYVGSDLALGLSNLLHGRTRAGQSVSLGLPNVDTIDASDVDTSLIGHSYYGDQRSVISDLYDVVRGVDASCRRHLMKTTTLEERYWKLRK